MANPNLVRKISDSPSGSSGEISPASVISTSNLSKNYLMNADMRISQRNSSYTAVANAQYTLDRWAYFKAGAMVHTVTQDTDVPSFAQSGQLFQNSLRLNLTTPDTSLAAAEFVAFGQKIEGYNFSEIAQKAFTLSFWVKATLPGIYCVSFTNGGADRTFVAEYNIDTPNTWEKKVVTVLASPDSGTWNYTNGVGLWVRWCLGTGTNGQTGTVNSWITGGGMVGTTNQVNGVNTGAVDFRITGIMLNEGEIAAPFKLFSESFDQELTACQRYYEKSYDLSVFAGTNTVVGREAFVAATTFHRHSTTYKCTKRATPTVSVWSATGVADTANRDAGATAALGSISSGVKGFSAQGAGFVTAVEYSFQWVADAEL